MDVAILHRPELAGTRWSIEVRDLGLEQLTLQHSPERLLRTASVAKVFLLLEVAERLLAGDLSPDQPVRRDTVAPVADSGLWQHLRASELPLADVACLVGAVSDNWASNALLDLVGLEPVRARARRTAPGGSTLLDRVRDLRLPGDPPTLSEGCAADWTGVFAGLRTGTVAAPATCRQVLDWLATGSDLSMVAAGFGLDPLAHATADRGVMLWNKTGTSDGVRADVGLVTTRRASWAYAVICNWDPADASLREPVLAAMRELGAGMAARLGAPAGI